MNEDFHFGLNKNKVPIKQVPPANDCTRTRWYGYLRRIAKFNQDERIEQQIQDEMDFIIEQQELEKRNHSFRTWLFNNKINSNDHYIKDLKNTLDTSFFRYVSNQGYYIDTDLIPLMVDYGWINKHQAEILNPIDLVINCYEVNPTEIWHQGQSND